MVLYISNFTEQFKSIFQCSNRKVLLRQLVYMLHRHAYFKGSFKSDSHYTDNINIESCSNEFIQLKHRIKFKTMVVVLWRKTLTLRTNSKRTNKIVSKLSKILKWIIHNDWPVYLYRRFFRSDCSFQIELNTYLESLKPY